MPFYLDQLGREIEIAQVPKRIISLVPSQTELLFDLGLDEEVAGITKFCVHPSHWHKTKTWVGGTKQLHLDKIAALQPDLILANKEENTREHIEELAKRFPVWVSDVNTLNDALLMMKAIGDITGTSSKAGHIINQVKLDFDQLPVTNTRIQTCYLIWKDPYIAVGSDTFINDMLQHAGFENMLEHQKRYPLVTIEQLQAINCQLLMLSSEPFPFRQKHMDELQPIFANTKIILTDGEMFSWYGSRLLKAPAYFRQLQNQVLSLTHARGTE